MKILVTGHRGFIGQNMVRSLESDGHEVVGYEWGDKGIRKILDSGIEYCIHLGAISSTTYSDVKQLLKQNYYFTIALANGCNERNISMQIASSASVYGTHNLTFKESDYCAPTNHYAWSKFVTEQYIRHRAWNIEIQLLRYFNVYGPNEDHKENQASPVHKFTQQAKETGTITVFEGSENFKRDFIHVDQVINIQKKLWCKTTTKPEVFNVGTGTEKSFMSVAQDIALEYNSKIITAPMPENLKNSYQKFTKADMTKTNYFILK